MPPASTCSRKPCMVGSRALRAKVLMRIRLVVTSGSPQTYSASALALSASKAGPISSGSPDFQRGDIEAERASRGLSLTHFQHGGGIADIDQDRQPVETGDNLAQKFEALASKFSCLVGQAGDIAAWPRQARDEVVGNRISRLREHDRDD